jgi:hypothetical protein
MNTKFPKIYVTRKVTKKITLRSFLYIHTPDTWRHDTQHNDIQPNDTQHNDTQHKGLVSDIEHNDTQHNETQPFY